MIGARIKIMWEEQLADPPIDYITSVNVCMFVFIQFTISQSIECPNKTL